MRMERVTLPISRFDLRVVDYEGSVGTITDSSDGHNVVVEFDAGGQGLYCLYDGCDMQDEFFILTIKTTTP